MSNKKLIKQWLKKSKEAQESADQYLKLGIYNFGYIFEAKAKVYKQCAEELQQQDG